MPKSDIEVAVIGAGAAGIGAARRLHDAGVDVLLIEARDRIGGRSWTVSDPIGGGLDLGCGWLHSGDRNPWTTLAEEDGFRVDRSPPPWSRRALDVGFPPADQEAFQRANQAFHDRLAEVAQIRPDPPASAALDPASRWNGLIDAISTYISGAELERVSAFDLWNYADTEVNWRVAEGYGAAIAGHGRGLPVALGAAVGAIDHSGPRVRIETAKGAILADQAIVTLPASLIAEEAVRFSPQLPGKVEAARALPLGLADKLYMALDGADEFEADGRVFGRTDSVATGAYHFRPLGKPIVEGYFGGRLAAELEQAGEGAFFDFAARELAGLFGEAFARRLRPLATHGWLADPFARGSYSFAVPGGAGRREALAAPVGEKLFFAGEACSARDYSTAHGALLTGWAAADAVINRRSSRN
ncbi:flavin monoamine oxidase family protein [Hansschlegelia plantiphila]|uniref:Tryptophan 2-monooxygenase n=1 Tax=Hansschlegelia plantiphila TaxID=374655 RepID=A0A9W6MU79_9HYPH|nr:NAD(P)/FAD-dependent oxidoreductase [Hansschlegelia plantiphila]GLK66385.1 amine oxidase [Hansschlegelia plantiphila]